VPTRPPIAPPVEARRFVDSALADLRASRWSAGGWGRFLAASLRRSWEDAWRRRWALVEVSAGHLAVAARRPGPWAAGSWAMAVTHLGLLGDAPRRLGWPNRLTLVRANLPALAPEAPAWIGLVALATDLLDGGIARHTADATAFGGYGDALADVAFWSWYALRLEEDIALRALCIGVWAAPAVVVTAAYLALGRAVDYPRPAGLRALSVTLQVLLTVRALTRAGSGRSRPRGPRACSRRGALRTSAAPS
jgi:phosphatidylglycerophosphate synthase